MNKDLSRIIEIPAGIEVSVDDKEVTVKGSGKELVKTFDMGKVAVSVTEVTGDGSQATSKQIELSAKGATRRESKMIGTIWAHLKNMIKGIQEGFVYELEICNVHFPMNVKKEGDRIVIKSFLGEKAERVSNILANVDVEIKGSAITVTSHDIEAAGQTAANLEKATRLTGRDRRIFQDGIFITNKCGRAI